MSNGGTPSGAAERRRLGRPDGAVLVAVFAAPHGDGIDRVAVAMNRGVDDVELRLPVPREGMAGASLIDTIDPARARAARSRSRTALSPQAALDAHPRRERRCARAALARARRRAARSTRSRAPRASAPTGGTSRASAPSSRPKPRSRCSPRSASTRQAKRRRAKAWRGSSTRPSGAASAYSLVAPGRCPAVRAAARRAAGLRRADRMRGRRGDRMARRRRRSGPPRLVGRPLGRGAARSPCPSCRSAGTG